MDLQWVSTVIPLPQLSWVIPFFSWEKSPSQPVGFETGRLLYPLTLRISSPAYGYSAPWPSRYSTIGIARCFHRIHAWEIDYPALCLQDSIFWKRKWFAGEKKRPFTYSNMWFIWKIRQLYLINFKDKNAPGIRKKPHFGIIYDEDAGSEIFTGLRLNEMILMFWSHVHRINWLERAFPAIDSKTGTAGTAVIPLSLAKGAWR